MTVFLISLIGGWGSVLVWRHLSWKALPWPEKALPLPLYQAHRGYWVEGEGENTLGAFKAARTRGYQMCELDVHLSADGVVVVFHDGDLQRVAGVSCKISQLSLAQLRQYHPIPSLKEVLTSAETPPYFNIELKTQEKWRSDLERAVVQTVCETQSEGRVLFSSFNPLCLWRLKALLPGVPRALLVTRERSSGNNILLRNLCLAPYLGLHLLHLDWRDISPESVNSYRHRGIPVALWTVNEAEKARQYLEAGVVSLISDRLPEKEKPGEAGF